ncbi:MAG: WYL domain-containing protein [Nitrosomonadales bacterium]|nr:WYL domain-containing protein [Nitrosomonadales bacterium]
MSKSIRQHVLVRDKKSGTLAGTRAILDTRQIHIRHFNRPATNTPRRRVVASAHCVYRSNWYLECWCHTRKALRRFSLDAIDSVRKLCSAAKNS